MNFPPDRFEKYFILNSDLLSIKKFHNQLINCDTIIYEVIRVKDFAPIFINEHLERLNYSAQQMGFSDILKLPIRESIQQLLEANPVSQKNIRLACCMDNASSKLNILIYFIPSKYPTAEEKSNGVWVETLHAERLNPTVKFENKLLRTLANKIISTQGCYEVLLVNHKGLITEGSRSNVFFITDKELITSPDSIVLGGITRQKVIEICRNLKLNLSFRCLSADEINTVKGCFLTGTSPGVLPVRQIGAQRVEISSDIIRRISNSYEEMVGQSIAQWHQTLKH